MVPTLPPTPTQALADGTGAEKTDCFECRATGTITCLGVATYAFHELAKVPPSQVGHRRWLAGFGATFVGAGFVRAFN
ncbi:hypothetical protein H257_11150 [Aphanomyces astaci]|uniref:DUF4536 domain-containing protein n=1 Tax=Aphanomyces astaci TaxID=112090 RepID=W4G3C7_APHAT|nr:hypothetical protein H257_11150 [Aphanomyces astaci]ETV74185.1 hypothetical protein H257_11150 [Aphanomyces astaci]|eukprot:XP_009836291.1 hypothetical protein H257_11150 [Aphanomyces astaci]